MKLIFLVLLMALLINGIHAKETPKDWSIIPILNYEYLSFSEQRIHSPGIGFMFTKGNMDPPLWESPDSLSIMGIAKQYYIQDSLNGYSELYYAINAMADKRMDRHSIFGAVISETDKPFYGGLRSFIVGGGYGYEFIRRENMSLLLGINLGVMDFGIELPNGKPLPVMLLPRVNFNVKTSFLDFSFMFLNKPEFYFTFFPSSRIRLVNEAVLLMSFRDTRDILFDTMLMYRFFSEDSKMGDFAGVGVGFKNGGFGFDLAEKNKSYDLLYHSVYGLIDLSFLQIRGGYLFNGIETYDLDKRKNIGNGFFINVMMGWQF